MIEGRPIPGWEGYYTVSTNGEVESLSRTVKTRNDRTLKVTGRTLKWAYANGYPVVTLRRPGLKTREYVHRLVALAHLPNPEMHALVRHLDDDRGNPEIGNLAWGSYSDNKADAIRNGRDANSQKTRCPRGHPYSEGNTRVFRGSRFCRACNTLLAQKYRKRKATNDL